MADSSRVDFDRGVQAAQDGPADSRPAEGYSRPQRRLHWAVAALVLFQLAIGLWMGLTPHQPHTQPLLHELLPIHVVIGSVIFALMLMRLSLRRRLGAPPPPPGTPLDAATLAHTNHIGFYVLLLSLPVVGWFAFAADEPAASAFRGVHGALALTLILAICAHLAGVVYHTYFRRDGLLHRMTD